VLLRERYREDGEVKNRTLANLSSWPEPKVEALTAALKGQAPAAGLRGAFEISRSLPHGHVAAVAMIIAAVIDSSSKLAIAYGRRAETAARSLGDVLGLSSCDEDDLYAAMDWLLPLQEAIEDALAGTCATRRWCCMTSSPPCSTRLTWLRSPARTTPGSG